MDEFLYLCVCLAHGGFDYGPLDSLYAITNFALADALASYLDADETNAVRLQPARS